MNLLEVRTATGELIGNLYFDAKSESYSFIYANEWITSPGGFPLSPSISFEAPAKSSTIKRFIENLLPEGNGLDDIARTAHVSKTNTFALVHIIGKESTGGLLLVPPDFQFKHPVNPPRLIPDEELQDRTRNRDTIPFSVWDGKVRLSNAGFQDKIAVFMNEGKIYFVEHPLASTHIIKPLPRDPRLETLVANEHYCMSLADAMKVSAAPTQIRRIPDPILIIERFDRKFNLDQFTVDRLHVIDGCQLLDLAQSYKNERPFGDGEDVAHVRDGASLKKFFACSTQAEVPILFKHQLMRWMIFQFLIGNADAHGKNLSFHIRPGGRITLSKMYDAVSTVIYNGLADTMAMSIGDEFKFDDVRAYQWALLARECDIPINLLRKEMREMATSALKHIESGIVDISSFTPEEKQAVLRIQDFIQRQCNALLRDAKLVKNELLDE